MAPEKIRNPHWVAAVSDIYALGCTLYYAVTGKVPFPGGSTRDKARRHCEETPWHPRQFNPDISDDFADLIADLMHKDPQRRIQSAPEVIERLVPWMNQQTELPHPSAGPSPWQAPPVPTNDREDTLEDLPAPGLAQTPPDGELRQVERPALTPPPPPVAIAPVTHPRQASSFPDAFHPGATPRRVAARRAVLRALMIAIPLSLLTGGLLTYLFLEFLR